MIKIIVATNRRKAWQKVNAFLWKNPEYSDIWMKREKSYFNGRVRILKKKPADVIKRAEEELIQLNYSMANNYGETK